MDKQTQLITYLDSIIERIIKIKEKPDIEIANEYFNLSCIAYSLEIYSIGGIRRRRRNNDDEDE